MKISALLRFLFCAFVATALSLNAFAQSAVGKIQAKMVQGEVSRIAANGTSTPLKNDELLAETDTVATGKGSSVVLTFENGSSLRIAAESRLAIEEFKIDPLDKPIDDLSALKAEPSRSKTVLNLSYGELVGDVKKLNTAGGSTYSVKTQVGAAGIRGTIFRIVFRPSSDGKAFFTISTAEGKVVMEKVSTQDIPVDAGKEVVVEIDTDNPANPKVVTQDIPAAVLAAINLIVQDLAQSLKDTVIDNSTPQSEATQKKEEAPPPPTPTDPNLTPGAGR